MKYVNNVDEAFDFVKSEISKLETKLANLTNVIPKQPALKEYSCKQIKELSNLYSYQDSARKILSGSSGEYQYNRALELLKQAYEHVEQVSKHNDVILENNRKIVASITELMTFYGIPKTYRVLDSKSRARFPKSIEKTSGWVVDLQMHVKTDDGRDNVIKKIKGFEETINTIRAQVVENEKKLEEEKQKELDEMAAEENRQVFLIQMIKKYDLAPNTSASNLFDFFMKSNKYLALARSLEKNRLDWSDGYEHAQDGLDKFCVLVENEMDDRIIKNIQNAIDDWDGDGRVFRDIEWSYGTLYDCVQTHWPSLYKDYIEFMNTFPNSRYY